MFVAPIDIRRRYEIKGPRGTNTAFAYTGNIKLDSCIDEELSITIVFHSFDRGFKSDTVVSLLYYL